MIGWIIGIDPLTRMTSYGINMSFPTAVMFLLCSIGLHYLFRLSIKNDYLSSILALTGITLLIFLINLTILTGLIIGVSTGMENLFVGTQYDSVLNITVAGMPAISTMIGFTLFCLAVIISLVQKVHHQKIIQFIGLLILILGVVAIIGYMTRTPLLFYQPFPDSIPMAFNTAISFFLLGLGLHFIGKVKVSDETQ